MILRRMMNNIKTQNWFAVVIEFVIVVFGVFVGLQVQEWSNERQFMQTERVYLQELIQEIETNKMLTQSRVDYMEIVTGSGERVLDFLEKDQPCIEDCWRLLVDFFASTQVLFAPALSEVYDEMKRLGLPRSNRIKNIVDEYYLLSETVYSGADRDPKYRTMVRELLPVKAHKTLWWKCHGLDGIKETISLDCAQGLSETETKNILESFRARPELIKYLNYWIGMHVLWNPVYQQQVGRSERAIKIIEEELQATN